MVGEGPPYRFLYHSGLYLVWREVVAVSKGVPARPGDGQTVADEAATELGDSRCRHRTKLVQPRHPTDARLPHESIYKTDDPF